MRGSESGRHDRWTDTAFSLDAPLKRFTDVSDVLLGNRAPRQRSGRKKTEKKSHASHAKHTKKSRPAMATLIPPEELLSLYSAGWFPMAMADGSIRCFSPDPRGILPLDAFHIPHGAKKDAAGSQMGGAHGHSFERVVRACANRRYTWIDETMVQSYLGMHRAGHAHSLEIWREGKLTGGLYGVRIGGAFFGESMFHQVRGHPRLPWCAWHSSQEKRLSASGYSMDHTAPHAIRRQFHSPQRLSAPPPGCHPDNPAWRLNSLF